jgi:flagellar protein FliS
MSQIRQGLATYRQTQVQSRTPLELVVMLYDGALRFTDQAKSAVLRRDVRARRDALGRIIAIVGELQNTLDLERGGEIASGLDELYRYMNFRLLDAAAKNDIEAIEDVRRVLETLRDGWATIAGGAAEPRASA